MKKFLILGLFLAIISNFAFAGETSDTNTIKGAISKYKHRNFLGCISDLRLYTEKDPSSAVAWYYLGNSYMQISMKPEAHEAFERVVQLNTVPKLTSYSIQAKLCMENKEKCKYQDFTLEQINKLKADPATFLEEYFANLNKDTQSKTDKEIEKLINGGYSGNIHPSASEFIRQERTKIKQNEINSNRAYIPTQRDLTKAIAMLQEQNNHYANMAMFVENNENFEQEEFQGNNMSPEMVQLMMMKNSMTNF